MKFLGLLSLVAVASAAPAAQLLERDSTTCGSNYYSSSAVAAAANAACNYAQSGEEVDRYPHQYKDYEGFYFGGLSGPFYEFPIMDDGSIFDGSTSPGADRVIIDSNCDIAGVITHTGASSYDGFVGCSGTS